MDAKSKGVRGSRQVDLEAKEKPRGSIEWGHASLSLYVLDSMAALMAVLTVSVEMPSVDSYML
jgi:hypothetical protein